ncbi:hypothetical protein SSPO_004470 [Streptomyces antimycoticus]|uniref:Uncharacterized protein n=1 Tax=Streptomyces antimycoticus TaxID=68175 RepID=A0A499UKU1_9ACTN|nr:hypothetical protein SSPO_004470 [Streptomyces antimycoticus]
MLPRVYQGILEVVDDAPGPLRAKQVVPRIGLLARGRRPRPHRPAPPAKTDILDASGTSD